MIDRILVFSGSGHPEMAAEIGAYKVLSVAPLFGEAIRRIHTGESISSLFV